MYGENSGALRAELSTLLRQHRIQQRIGGAGLHTVPATTTVFEREEIGRLIQRYRYGILTWCQQALSSAAPTLDPLLGARPAPADKELRRRLTKTMNASTATLPTMDDLTGPHKFPLVEAWRLAARAAALGEHDFAGEVAQGRLDINQRLTVTKDTAEIIHGLIVLDRRYSNIPAWEPLSGTRTLQRAAQDCAHIEASDCTVDRRGWRPPTRPIDGPTRAGIAGVIQAQHNTLVHLTRVPNALNFKRLLDSQRELSDLLATRTTEATAPEASARWVKRETTYANLRREARNLDGRIGAGGAAVAEAANAISRLRRLPKDTQLSQRARRDLTTLCNGIDQRLAELFERGARERLYFVSAKVPYIVANDGQITHRLRERFMPITSPVQTDLIRMVREDLRPPPIEPSPPPGARASRLELTRAISHRPQERAEDLGL
jgi:hypothetical protein